MAQSGFTPIKLYLSTTAAATPTAANLEPGELALNNNDGKLYYEDSSGVVQVIATKAGASGDVVGPASATDNAIARYDGATGKLIQNSGVTIDDSNNVSGVVQLNATTVDTTNIEVTNLKAKDGTAAGSIADSTGIVTLASSVLTTTDINGGTVDGTTIGATTPSTVVATQVDITAQGDLRLQDTTGGEYVALQAPATIATSYTLTLPVDDGTAGQALITDGSGVLSWSTAASGDVYGPASATDNAVARYDGTTGKIIQNSAVTIGDDGATVIAANSTTDGLRITQLGTGNALLVEDSANPDATPTVIDASGNVGIGATSPTQAGLVISKVGTDANTSARLALKSNETSASTYMRLGRFGGGDDSLITIGNNYNRDGGTFAADYSSYGVTNILFDDGFLSFGTGAAGSTSPTERMRVNSVGAVGIGGTPSTGQTLALQKNITGNIDSTTVRQIGVVQSDVTSSVYAFDNVAQTAATAFTLAAYRHFVAQQGTFGVGSTVTNQYGFFAESTLTGATNNYGFYGNIASGTGRYNFYAAGTADNFFAGNVGIGTTTMSQVFNVTAVNASGFVGQRIQNNNSSSGLAGVEFSSDSTYSKSAIAQVRTSPNGAGPLVFYVDSNTDAANWASGDEKMRIAVNGAISLGGTSGSQSLSVTPVTSSVNYWDFYGSATGSDPYVFPSGSDTNRGFIYLTKGTGTHQFMTGSGLSNTQFLVAHAASAVNYLQVSGAPTGSGVSMRANGSDTNIDVDIFSKGSGSIALRTDRDGTAPTQFAVAHTASAVNYLSATGAATGNSPSLNASGSDTNISIGMTPKGTGGVGIGTTAPVSKLDVYAASGYIDARVRSGTNQTYMATDGSNSYFGTYNNIPVILSTNNVNRGSISAAGVWSLGGVVGSESLRVTPVASAVNYWQFYGAATGGSIAMYATGSNTNISIDYISKGTGAHYFSSNAPSSSAQFAITNTASAVNYLQVTGAATGSSPVLSAQGSDANISVQYFAKGTGGHYFYNSAGYAQFVVTQTATAVNYLQVRGAITGAAATLSAQGSDTNIDLALTPKGTGVLSFGTYTAGVVAQAGYITIKDAGGTTRRLLVG